MAKKFPDLTGDGKVTQADILKGRGVGEMAKGGMAKGGKWIQSAIKKPGALREALGVKEGKTCLLYTSPSPRDLSTSRMPSSA